MSKEAITEKAALKVIEQEQFDKFEKALRDAREAFNALNLAKEGMDAANADISKMFIDMSARLRLTKDFRPQYLEAFMKHNFAMAQKDPRRPEELVIAVPKIWGYSAGWWEREDDGYNYFRASRFIDLWMDLPDEVRQILQLGEKLPITLMNGYLMAPPELTARVEEKYGKFLERKLDKGKWVVKPRSIFDIRIKLVRDGIVPFVKEPIPQDMIWERELKFKLRPHQAEAVELFKEYNSIGVFWPGGQGKTFFGMAAMSIVKPRYLIVMRSKLLVQQWKDRIEEFTTLPHEDYDVGTYQTALTKWKTKKYTLAIFDELQHIPAPTFFELAYFNTLYRIGLSSSPFREDGKTDLIIGISGYPTGLKWDYFKEKGLITFPSVDVWIVKGVNDKFKTINDLLLDQKPTMIFCDHLEFGKAIAGRFETEFVSGETKKQLEKVRETLAEKKVVVVSRVGDEGISVPELRRTIEADFLFGSRAQEIQRVMRLFHSAEKGEHHVIMTVGEYEGYRKRLFSLLSKGFDVATHYEGIERTARLTYHEPVGVKQRSPARKKLVPMPTQQVAPIKAPVFSGMPGYEKLFASLRPAQQSLIIFLKERDGQWVKTSKIYPMLGYQTYQGMMNTVNLPELEKRKLIERGTGKIRTNFQGLTT